VERLVAAAQTGQRRTGIEREFLPAALEILETPPSPATRLFGFVICLAFGFACVWAYFGRIDVVAVASGKTISRSRAQVVQPQEPGQVAAIHIREGDLVHAGQVLIELDPTGPNAEAERARRDLEQARLDKTRLQILLGDAPASALTQIAGVGPVDLERAEAQLAAQRAENDAKLYAIDREVAEKTADLAAARRLSERAQKSLPIIEEKAEIRRKVTELQFGSRLSYLDAQQQVIEARSDVDVQKERIDGAVAALEGLDRRRAEVAAEFRKSGLADLSRAIASENAAIEALAKATHRRDLQVLRSPMDGTVQQLAVNTLGGAVTPAQQLMVIVPSGDALDVEAVIPNREIGFVAPGQDVEIKVDAFPFTRYGVLHGKVEALARDAETAPAHGFATGSARSADLAANVEGGDRLIYTARISLSGPPLVATGHTIDLLPGMSVKAEIKTGERRVLDFLLSPLEEYVHDSLRER
jgi:hemolysin D